MDSIQAVRDVLEDGGSMTKTKLRRRVVERFDVDHRDAQLAIVELIDDGELEEHPEFDGAYRLVGP
ncbi:hypothetical protein [Halorientalis litorea]|uniref:hypothetical protein n=1 Tax=Halorientalis litorea TaxID=2931977 RepID=UPI001FF3D7CE|nr:hypothetical protein [Halorientalis litorea]